VAIYDPQGDWIFHEHGVKLILELYNVGEPHADIIVKRYRKSDEVRYCEDCAGFPPVFSGFPFSKTYFLDYLERNPPGTRRAKQVKERRRIATEKQIREFVRGHIAEGLPLDKIEELARNGELKMSRQRVRAEYHKQPKNLRRGRPPKNNSPK
jgi:hypothetical protein